MLFDLSLKGCVVGSDCRICAVPILMRTTRTQHCHLSNKKIKINFSTDTLHLPVKYPREKVHKHLFDSLHGRENRSLQGAIKFASNKKAEEKIIKTDSVQCMCSTSLPASSIDNLTSSGSIRDSSPTSNCCITRWTSLDQRGQSRK